MYNSFNLIIKLLFMSLIYFNVYNLTFKYSLPDSITDTQWPQLPRFYYLRQ